MTKTITRYLRAWRFTWNLTDSITTHHTNDCKDVNESNNHIRAWNGQKASHNSHQMRNTHGSNEERSISGNFRIVSRTTSWCSPFCPSIAAQTHPSSRCSLEWDVHQSKCLNCQTLRYKCEISHLVDLHGSRPMSCHYFLAGRIVVHRTATRTSDNQKRLLLKLGHLWSRPIRKSREQSHDRTWFATNSLGNPTDFYSAHLKLRRV